MAYGGMVGGSSTQKKEGNPLARFGGPSPVASGKGNPLAGYGKPQKPKAAAKKKGKATRGSYPGVGAEAQAAAGKAQARAGHYRDVKRAANNLRKKIKANNGELNLAGREQRSRDLARMRTLDAQAERDRKAAQGMGLRMGGGKSSAPAAAKSVAKATSGGSSSGGGGGGGSSSSGGGGSTPASTSGGSKPTGARMGAAIRNARAARETTTGISISAGELKRFIARYENAHSGKLSRENAVLLARLVKKRGGKAAAYYGLGGSSPNPYDSAAPGTGIH